MENVGNYVKAREWLHTITALKGNDLKLIAKLEYESGIDVEAVADGLKLQCEDDSCIITSMFYVYNERHVNEFELTPAGDHFRLAGKWYAFNEESKAKLLQFIMVKAMRSAPREKVIEQQQRHLRGEIERTKANIKKHGLFHDAFEALLRTEQSRRK